MARGIPKNKGSGPADGRQDGPNRANSETATAERPREAEQPRELSPEARAKLAEIRSRIEISVGQVALMMMQLPRYRHQTLGDLNHLVIEPLLRDRVAIAYAKGEGAEGASIGAPVGVAIWASVSEAVDARIREQVKEGAFPVRLGPDDWASGEKLWLLDIVSLTRHAASAVMLNFAKIAEGRSVQIHPAVAHSVEPKVLQSLRKNG
jgi:hemolysin-activating ACP:hemolysin acyltransferase